MKIKFIVAAMLLPTLIWGQIDARVNTAVDTTQVQLAEQINLTLQVEADSLAMIEFPATPSFLPFEIVVESPIDTLRTQQYYLYTKRYALIQFDSGNYWIPPQKIVVDGFSKFSDSVAIRVNNVAVDTLTQPLYDIKPIQLVERSYAELIQQLLTGLAVIALLVVLYILNRQYRKKKEALLEEIPPFERALNELKALEEDLPTKQEEYKLYYSKMTAVVRRYLEEAASIDALESTSDELLSKLELRKDAGALDLSAETINSLKQVLQQADLVKFARSAPDRSNAIDDRNRVEQVVIDTKAALPEPTLEEIEASAAFQRKRERIRQQQKIQLMGISALAVLVIAALVSIAVYGFIPVKDTLFRYPTKVLLDGTWVKSQYGTPSVAIETPAVLLRQLDSNTARTRYSSGNLSGGFYTELQIEARTPSPEKKLTEEEQQQVAQDLLNDAVKRYEENGAVNLLVQNDNFTTSDGTQALRLYGSLDMSFDNQSKRYRFVSIIFPFESATIELKLMFDKNDRYGPAIEDRILNSLTIVKEL